MYAITKAFSFAAAHSLPQLPDGHKCRRVHGHNYEVLVELRSEELDDFSFVKDYGDLYPIKDFLMRELDHQDLNEKLPFEPTAENLAKFLYETFKPDFSQLWSVTVRETPKTSATYTGTK